jgi:hypothetical protein
MPEDFEKIKDAKTICVSGQKKISANSFRRRFSLLISKTPPTHSHKNWQGGLGLHLTTCS